MKILWFLPCFLLSACAIEPSGFGPLSVSAGCGPRMRIDYGQRYRAYPEQAYPEPGRAGDQYNYQYQREAAPNYRSPNINYYDHSQRYYVREYRYYYYPPAPSVTIRVPAPPIHHRDPCPPPHQICPPKNRSAPYWPHYRP